MRGFSFEKKCIVIFTIITTTRYSLNGLYDQNVLKYNF